MTGQLVVGDLQAPAIPETFRIRLAAAERVARAAAVCEGTDTGAERWRFLEARDELRLALSAWKRAAK